MSLSNSETNWGTAVFTGKLKYILGMILFPFLVFTATGCVPEKGVKAHTKLKPMYWINETDFIVRQGNQLFRYSDNKSRETIMNAPSREITSWKPQLPILPKKHEVFYYKDNHRYVNVNGEKHRVSGSYPLYGGINQHFPTMKIIPFQSYIHLGRSGILIMREGEVQKIELPTLPNGNGGGIAVIKDDQLKRLFAFQPNCTRSKPSSCKRTGWWLNEKLEVLSTVTVPEQNLLYTKEKLSCFSCGCGCYTQERVHAVDGNIYFHIVGFPLSDSQRGLYKVTTSADGSTSWAQVIRGRIEPPLSFSPNGCKVAYMKVSRFGDKIDVADLCK